MRARVSRLVAVARRNLLTLGQVATLAAVTRGCYMAAPVAGWIVGGLLGALALWAIDRGTD